MTLNIVEDIRTVSELKTKTRDILDQLHRTGRPIVITVNGKPDAVLVDAAEFQRRQQALDLAALLAEGEAETRAGRTIPAAEVLAELEELDG